MKEITFLLYRVKFIQDPDLFISSEKSKEKFFLEALIEKPSAELRKGHIWHIGNLQQLTENENYGLFAIGRTATKQTEKFDIESRDFITLLDEQSPFTYVLFLANLGVIAIARKYILTSNTNGVAEKIRKLLSATKTVLYNKLRVEVDIIPDPDDFLEKLNDAYKVIAFSATFKGPNPFDADEYFQKPNSAYLNAAHGTLGESTIYGEDLNRDVITQVTHSSAATSNLARAKIIDENGKKAHWIKMKKEAARVSNDSNGSVLSHLNAIESRYNEIRANNDNEH
ncbi:hypothetical protein [Chromobacterium haemolyticum]|uniref:hypothetical protein n=1 Tax=Chromobacterium haemolyticum TaxID=394935 RepID=UPI0013B46900|nr:hypothetical protein [Chromobacterium haemolyticum]